MAAPDDVEARNNLGNALQHLGRTADAAEAFARALKARPGDQIIRTNLARAELRLGHYNEAIESFGGTPLARFANALALPIIPASHDEMRTARARLEHEVEVLANDPPSLDIEDIVSAPTNFYAAYAGLNDCALQRRLGEAYLRACPALGFKAPALSERNARPRVGFASAHFSGHTVSRLMMAICEGLPDYDIDVELFQLGGDFRAAREAIARAKLDVLVYPDIGMEPYSYFLAFARLAPVQCVSLGHPITTGLPEMDVFFTTDMAEPAGAEAHYTERLARCATMNVCVDRPEVPDDPFPRDRGAHLYVCPQSLFKVHPEFDELLSRILAADAKAEIVFLEGQEPTWSKLLMERFRRVIGTDAERVRFLPRQSGADYLRLLKGADVILDTPHFCGGLSSYEAFACATPIVTLPSRFLRGRVTAGLYKQMALEDAVARDPADYVRRAVTLAGSPSARAALSDKITARSPLIFGDHGVVEAHALFFKAAATR
jgi:predicted O-linked N-acetylglucosamine transferase (SPINDLY family)